MTRENSNIPSAAVSLERLQDLIAQLRAPDGCPWDRKQTLGDLRAYVIEEAHEVAAAIDRSLVDGKRGPLAEELGDLLFQIAFIGQLAVEEGSFDLQQVVDGICDKMIARHPHVFSDGGVELHNADEVVTAWERRKLEQRQRATGSDATAARQSHVDGVPVSLPALVGAYRLTQKAAGLGFDWPNVAGVFAKVREELNELEEAIESNDKQATQEELGDLLFTMGSLGRHLGHDPEAALAHANLKFRRRFAGLELYFEQRGESLAAADLDAMDEAWTRIKAEERA